MSSYILTVHVVWENKSLEISWYERMDGGDNFYQILGNQSKILIAVVVESFPWSFVYILLMLCMQVLVNSLDHKLCKSITGLMNGWTVFLGKNFTILYQWWKLYCYQYCVISVAGIPQGQ